MIFNLTLVIQIINFVIAYFLISRYLLKPGLIKLLKKENYIKDLNNNLELRSQKLNLLEQDLGNLINSSNNKFSTYLNKIKDIKSDLSSKTEIKYCSLDYKETQESEILDNKNKLKTQIINMFLNN